MSGDDRPGLLGWIVLYWLAVPLLFFWLPLVRSVLDGSTYQWANRWGPWRVGGVGLEGDVWYLVLGAGLGLALLWSGARGGSRFFRWVAPVWMTLLLARAIHFALTSPDGFVFHGDTLGIRLDLTWVAPTYHALGLLLFGLWFARQRRLGRPAVAPAAPTLGRVLALAALLPLRFRSSAPRR